jgi:hypothetical protein
LRPLSQQRRIVLHPKERRRPTSAVSSRLRILLRKFRLGRHFLAIACSRCICRVRTTAID